MPKIPVIYGADGSVVSAGGINFVKDAGKNTGSMANWQPTRIQSTATLDREREGILSRSINLVNDDPHAAGIIDSLATTIIGPGLKPLPTINADVLGITKKQARVLTAKLKSMYKDWGKMPDAGGRMSDGEIQHLKCRCLFGFGESLELVHMRTRPGRKYQLCTQVINPLRLKTPIDKQSDGNIQEGVECGKYGEPVAYWIKKAEDNGRYTSDTSENFVRIPAMKGHRPLVLHDFITKDPEQRRGYPILSPAMRFFRDFSDLVGAELTSNVVTAALSVFVEAQDPNLTGNNQLIQGTPTSATGADRKQGVSPGEIWYGTAGQKPHLLSADRPGSTFEPFTKLIKKSIAMATGIPFPVLFKDIEGVSFAGFRSAMLEAWRVFSYHRYRIGQGDCQTKYEMLAEEAYLTDNLDTVEFYGNIGPITSCNWYGAPKGDIEPFKAIQADLLKRKAKVKTLDQIIIEDGGPGVEDVASNIEDENEILADKGLLGGDFEDE